MAQTRIVAVVGAALQTRDGQRVLASIVLGADGERLHPEQHLDGAEREVFDAAANWPRPALEVEGWRVALAVCFDAAVPAQAAAAAAAGADLYAVSGLYVTGEERRLDVHMASRAMDRMHVAFATLAGPSAIGASCGANGTWAPDGSRRPGLGIAPGRLVVGLHEGTQVRVHARHQE